MNTVYIPDAFRMSEAEQLRRRRSLDSADSGPVNGPPSMETVEGADTSQNDHNNNNNSENAIDHMSISHMSISNNMSMSNNMSISSISNNNNSTAAAAVPSVSVSTSVNAPAAASAPAPIPAQTPTPAPTPLDMGYEACAPQQRRNSMTQTERRASIQAVMADESLTPMEKRRSIQHLMDGRRHSMTTTVSTTTTATSQQQPPLSPSSHLSSNDGFDMNNSDHAHRRNRQILGTDTVVHTYGDNDTQSSNHSDMTNSASIGITTAAIANAQTRRAEQRRPHCPHYERQCTLISPCCGAAFGCRICHDDCAALPPKINNGGKKYHRSASLPSSFTNMDLSSTPQDNHHQIDRFAVREIVCRVCYTRQSSKTNQCINPQCRVTFGAYHCSTCNLWMADEEEPYHCADCGFCRVGGRDNFKHCHSCGMCIDRNLYDTHNCKAGKYRSNCPVCQEYLFSSRGASHEMPCGHAIHWDCFRQLAAHDSRCPVCKKTAETRERMMPTWNSMAAGVAMQPIPPELARVVSMTCNDCEQSEDARAWHFLGMQCTSCSSFNTVVDRMILQGEEAHEFLELQKQRAAILAAEQQQLQEIERRQQERAAEPRPREENPSRPGGGTRQPRRFRVNRRRSAF